MSSTRRLTPFQCSLDIKEQVLSSEHYYTATTLNNLANLYRDQGRYEEAESLFQRAFAIYEKVLGSEHPYTRTTLHKLALLYWDQEHSEKQRS